MPAAEQAITARLEAAAAAVETARAALTENQTTRRALEKEVAAVDTRMARFDDHKAAVKTNHEYTALLHEIATAKTEKDGIEEKILVLMEAADGLSAALKAAEAAVAVQKKDTDSARAALVTERTAIEAELARLVGERVRATSNVPPPVLARYEQILKQRRGVAVARMTGESCEACHVRLRPTVTLQVRRNAEIVQCDSCSRILYYEAPVAEATAQAQAQG